MEILSREGKEVGLCVKSGFLTVALLTFWKRAFCNEVGGCPVHCRKFSTSLVSTH